MNRFTAIAVSTVAASAALFSAAAFAQAADTAPAGRTRAEVVAETRIALRNGEIRDGHEWAMYQPQPAARPVPAKLAATATSR